MELRVLQYFLAVAREESITKAAESLRMTQPSLSRQLRELENELGKALLVRGSKKTTLTEDGMLLRKRAQEIIELSQKAETELRQSNDITGGDVWIGGGESEGMRLIAHATYALQKDFPDIHIHLISANAVDIIERLEKGLIDFGVGVGNIDANRYDSMCLPAAHTSGLLVRKDSPLASRPGITPDDLKGIPIISPRNEAMRKSYEEWMGAAFDTLNVVATFNLIYNAAFMVEERVGHALCIDRLVNTSGEHPLCFIPCEPRIESRVNIAWKKHQVFSKASEKFIERLKGIIYVYAETSATPAAKGKRPQKKLPRGSGCGGTVT